MKQTTLCLLMKENKILLGMKKRRFGVGRWNGFGGKIDESKGDKNIMDALFREVEEESGIKIKNPEQIGLFRFRFAKTPEWDQDTHLFLVKNWEGDPKESEEMKPEWFDVKSIPYKDMWPDDIHWMPHILRGEKVEADFLFGENDKILKHNIKVVEEI